MVILVKSIELGVGSGVGFGTNSTTSSSYIEGSQSVYARLDTSQYSDATYYYEAVFKTSAATGYSSLYTTGGSAVSGSEVTTTSTSATRVRSGSISPSTGDYTDRWKNDGSNTTTWYASRIWIVQSASVISNTESQIILTNYVWTSTSSSYANFSTIFWSLFLYTAANWDGTVSIYYEATLKTSAATGYTQLHTAGDSAVSGSEITTTSTSLTRVRSGSITLSDGTEYKGKIKNDGSNTTTVNGARLIIQQSGYPTKTESYLSLVDGGTIASVTSGSFQDALGRARYDSSEWSVDTINWYHEVSLNSNVTTGTLELYGLTSAARVTGSNIATSVSSNYRARSGSLTMPSSQDITSRADADTGTIYQGPTFLLAVISWTNVFPTTTSTTTSTTTTSTSTTTTSTSTTTSSTTSTSTTTTSTSITTTSTSLTTTSTSTTLSTSTSTSTTTTLGYHFSVDHDTN